jgi:hypothetical protein
MLARASFRETVDRTLAPQQYEARLRGAANQLGMPCSPSRAAVHPPQLLSLELAPIAPPIKKLWSRAASRRPSGEQPGLVIAPYLIVEYG